MVAVLPLQMSLGVDTDDPSEADATEVYSSRFSSTGGLAQPSTASVEIRRRGTRLTAHGAQRNVASNTCHG